MTYFFSGVIAPGAGEACLHDLASKFGGRFRVLPPPLTGFALAFAADHERPLVSERFDESLVRWSEAYSAHAFVRLDVECFGGVCDQWGFAFRGGKVLARTGDDTGAAKPSPLETLCAAAGMPISAPEFEPFQRHWFPPATAASRDLTIMRVALELAAALKGRTGVNPTVGCVIVKDGVIVGEGATGEGGRPHAEEVACDAAGEEARGATAYVTLEPCAQRSTGVASCSERLVAAGVARAVIATEDPHPLANGVGLERLRAAGMDVSIGILSEDARAMNADFFARL